MVDPDHVALSITRQCRLVSIARSSFYYEGTGESPLNLQLLRRIDEQFLETPFYGSRQMTRWLRRQGTRVSRKRVRRLMRLLGLQAIFQRPRTSEPHPEHRIYPYLLRDSGDHAAESRVVLGRDVHPADARLSLSGRGHGLGEPEDLGLAAVEHARVELLCRSLGRGARTLRAPPRSSTPTRGANSQAWPSPTGSRTPGSKSRWTARAAGWITSSSSGCGARSNMSRSTWRSTPRAPTPAPASAGGSSSTTSGDRTRRSGTERPTKRTMWGLLRDRGSAPPHHSPRRPDL